MKKAEISNPATRYSLLVDLEGAELTPANDLSPIKRSKIPFSKLKEGKFRKLFNRHDHTFKS